MRLFKAVFGGLLDGIAAIFALGLFLFLLLFIAYCVHFIFFA